MKITRNRKKGFTLLEIIITLLFIVIFFGLIMGITQFSLAFFRNEDSQIMSQSSLRLIATQFEKDVRRHVVTKDDLIIVGKKYQISVDDSSPIIYELVDNKVYRDDILIGENIKDFEVKWADDVGSIYFDLVIRGFADGYDRENEVVVRIVIRTGKGG